MSPVMKTENLLREIRPAFVFVGMICTVLIVAIICERLDTVEGTSDELLIAYRQELGHRVATTLDQAVSRSQDATAKDLAFRAYHLLSEADKFMQVSNIRGAMSKYRSARYTVELAENVLKCGKKACS
jgi:hypothetical protein